MKPLPTKLRERFDAKHDAGELRVQPLVGADVLGPCWTWYGASNGSNQKRPFMHTKRKGHDYYWVASHVATAAYDQGLCPFGYEVHHICERGECVNPNHLLIVGAFTHLTIHRIPSSTSRVAKGLALKGEMKPLFDRGARLMA